MLHRHVFSFHKLLGHVVSPCLTFWETARQFSQVVVPFYTPTSHFSISSSICFIVCLFYYTHLSEWKVASHDFDLTFLTDGDVGPRLMFLLVIYVSSLEKCPFESVLHFQVVLFVFYYWVVVFLIYYRYKWLTRL